MKKGLLFFLLIVLSTLELDAQEGDADKILGVWKSPSKSVMIKVDKIGKHFQGRIVWIQAAAEIQPVLDINNPDERLKKMPLKGTKVIQELSFDPSKTAWQGGTFYNYEEGKLYNCHVVLQDEDQLKITRYLKNPADAIVETWVRQ